jgi:hypothetical protein
MITIIDALQNLRPKAEWVLRGDSYDGLEWLDETQSQPTEAEVLAEVALLEAEWNATEYQRLRAAEYPPMSDFADAYYWMQKGKSDLMDVYVARCEAVKQKYPK